MQSRDFCFWLQGFFEIANPQELDQQQTKIIRQHLALVFRHEIDPSMPDPTGELQKIHDFGTGSPPASPFPPPSTGLPEDIRYRC